MEIDWLFWALAENIMVMIIRYTKLPFWIQEVEKVPDHRIKKISWSNNFALRMFLAPTGPLTKRKAKRNWKLDQSNWKEENEIGKDLIGLIMK